MSMFATVYVDNSIDLPYFPEEIDRTDMQWQSKQGLDVYGGPYRITEDGRLEEKEKKYREKTDSEKQAEAEKWGFDSWEEYYRAYEECESSIVPRSVDWDADECGAYDDEAPPTILPDEQTLASESWEDINQHGTFEFHQLLRRDPIEFEQIGDSVERPSEYGLEVYVEYEARFTGGDLDEIIFMGSRGQESGEEAVEFAVEQVEEWREWKEDNE